MFFGALAGASSRSGVKTPIALENSNKNKSFKNNKNLFYTPWRRRHHALHHI